jgi:release factor glutamine methyltransferase
VESGHFDRVTVLEIIKRSTEYLIRQSVESPRLQSELLLAHVLGIPRLRLYLDFEQAVSPAQIDKARELVKRRGIGEPLQHILGTACFCGYDLKVNRHVLVPRPETEILAEKAWDFLKTRTASSHVLDYGTGSGCLAIAIAARFPSAMVTALDISPEALQVAMENAMTHHVNERLQLLEGSDFYSLAGRTFDLIVSNPPYIPRAEIETLDREVRDFDPRLALDGGEDGLDFYRMIAQAATDHLEKSGRLMVEFGDGQSVALSEIFTSANWFVLEIIHDYSGRPRILVAARQKP